MSSHSEQNARVREQFAKQAVAYAAVVQRTADASLDPLVTALEPVSTDRLLDVGCGTGRFALKLAPLVAEVIGVDLTDAMLEQARRLQAEMNVTNVTWQQCDVTALPFEDESFDRVSSQAMLHHVASPADVVAEMRRVCKPGGRMIVIDMTPEVSKAPALNAIELLRDPSHARAMTSAELRSIGIEMGLAETAYQEYATKISLEAVLQTSPVDGVTLERIRRLYRLDAESGGNAFGMNTQIENGQILVSCPMTMLVWRRH